MTLTTKPYDTNLKELENQITEAKNKLKYKEYIEIQDEDELKLLFVDFVPKSLDLTDANILSKKEQYQNSNNLENVGVEHLPRGTFSKIQMVQDMWWESMHQFSNQDKDEKDKHINYYNNLSDLILIFLGTTLSRSSHGVAELFGMPLGETKLSDGQKILLQLAIAIYVQGGSIHNLILFLDEPENHLHPSAVIEVVDKLRELVNDGQIWISTHSISLLAHFNPSVIWYMESNEISYAGRQPEKVLKGLLGDEDQSSRLSDFLTLPAQLGSNHFAYECLFEPHAIQTGVNDIQTKQIKRAIEHFKVGKETRILDYGAGKGRLADAVFYSDHSNNSNTKEWLDYIAYDEFPIDKLYCEAAIERIYGNVDNRYFIDENTLLSKYDEESFDVIVMCNVLHEIPHTKWINLFNADGMIVRLLKDEGILLLVEDSLIPTGEKAHQNGFLVLSTNQIKQLFSIKEEDSAFQYFDARNDQRLMAYQIPKNYLSRITFETRRNALVDLSKVAKNKIKEIRRGEATYKNGKLHGFWVQQFANSQLALEDS